MVEYYCVTDNNTRQNLRFFVGYDRQRIGYTRQGLYTAARIDDQSVVWRDIAVSYRLDRKNLQVTLTSQARNPGAEPSVPLHCTVVE